MWEDHAFTEVKYWKTALWMSTCVFVCALVIYVILWAWNANVISIRLRLWRRIKFVYYLPLYIAQDYIFLEASGRLYCVVESFRTRLNLCFPVCSKYAISRGSKTVTAAENDIKVGRKGASGRPKQLLQKTGFTIYLKSTIGIYKMQNHSWHIDSFVNLQLNL